MDRIKDSGSFDWGSTPHGFTRKNCQAIGFQSVGNSYFWGFLYVGFPLVGVGEEIGVDAEFQVAARETAVGNAALVVKRELQVGDAEIALIGRFQRVGGDGIARCSGRDGYAFIINLFGLNISVDVGDKVVDDKHAFVA